MKKVLQYLLSLSLAVLLLWYAFSGLDIQHLISKLKEINYNWIYLSVVFALVSHALRAYRWNALIEPMGYKLTTFRTFLAVMVGYFSNLFIPRMGEVTRCGVLKKLEKVPVSTSLGTVITERLVDVLCLGLLFTSVLIFEFEIIKTYLFQIVNSTLGKVGRNLFLIYLIGGILAGLLLILFIVANHYKTRIRRNPLFQKIRSKIRELVKGALSIRNVKNKPVFIISSILIWVMYFYMSYIVFFSISSTAHLSFWVGLTVLAMGSLGMAAPVQGGIGAYHVLVSSILLAYGVPEGDGVLLATVIHTSQTLIIIIFGIISFFIAGVLSRRDSDKAAAEANNPASFVKEISVLSDNGTITDNQSESHSKS